MPDNAIIITDSPGQRAPGSLLNHDGYDKRQEALSSKSRPALTGKYHAIKQLQTITDRINGINIMVDIKTPLLGWAFNDVLNELHQLVFHGVPGESEPFELTMLEREYIAFVLAVYYQCGRCLEFHERAIKLVRRKEKSPEWDWKEKLVNATLFLHLDGRKLSELEWQYWLRAWSDFEDQIDQQHSGLASYIAYAIGIARHDTHLMDHAFDSISAFVEDNNKLKSVVRDIDGVVVFMKAATSKNRSDTTIIKHLKARGIGGF